MSEVEAADVVGRGGMPERGIAGGVSDVPAVADGGERPCWAARGKTVGGSGGGGRQGEWDCRRDGKQ